ncbi:MAG: mechanosensitive ion channel family protein [Phycisphaerales bacterium]
MQSQTPDNQRDPSQAEEVASAAQDAAADLAGRARGAIESWIPDGWLPDGWEPWAVSIALVIAALLLAMAVHMTMFLILRRSAKRDKTPVGVKFLHRFRKPMRLLLPLLALRAALPVLGITDDAFALVEHLLTIGLIIGAAGLLIAASNGIGELLLARHGIAESDDQRARRVHTQIDVITRLVKVIIIVIAIGAILMTFPRVRQLGTSLLASAGIAGIVVGLAARPMLSNIIAGLQIALAEPIRLDDVVIVAGEWGRIEEITSTYVVVRVWDERRLIVPLTHFLEQPFQNWTRYGTELLGTAILHLDYRAPVGEIRDKLREVCEASDLWDERKATTQVTDTSERTMTVRLLVSAKTSSDLWDLRCEVREKMLAWLRAEHPECLPVVRAEVAGEMREATGESGEDPGDDPDAKGGREGEGASL